MSRKNLSATETSSSQLSQHGSAQTNQNPRFVVRVAARSSLLRGLPALPQASVDTLPVAHLAVGYKPPPLLV